MTLEDLELWIPIIGFVIVTAIIGINATSHSNDSGKWQRLILNRLLLIQVMFTLFTRYTLWMIEYDRSYCNWPDCLFVGTDRCRCFLDRLAVGEIIKRDNT